MEQSELLDNRRSASSCAHTDGEWVYCDNCWWQDAHAYFDLVDTLGTACECGAPLLILHGLTHYEMRELEGGASMAFIVARRRMLKAG